jgi:hypothetical protein
MTGFSHRPRSRPCYRNYRDEGFVWAARVPVVGGRGFRLPTSEGTTQGGSCRYAKSCCVAGASCGDRAGCDVPRCHCRNAFFACAGWAGPPGAARWGGWGAQGRLEQHLSTAPSAFTSSGALVTPDHVVVGILLTQSDSIVSTSPKPFDRHPQVAHRSRRAFPLGKSSGIGKRSAVAFRRSAGRTHWAVISVQRRCARARLMCRGSYWPPILRCTRIASRDTASFRSTNRGDHHHSPIRTTSVAGKGQGFADAASASGWCPSWDQCGRNCAGTARSGRELQGASRNITDNIFLRRHFSL